jgi:hypothetical protein
MGGTSLLPNGSLNHFSSSRVNKKEHSGIWVITLGDRRPHRRILAKLFLIFLFLKLKEG